jgi:hypothetical protein
MRVTVRLYSDSEDFFANGWLFSHLAQSIAAGKSIAYIYILLQPFCVSNYAAFFAMVTFGRGRFALFSTRMNDGVGVELKVPACF